MCEGLVAAARSFRSTSSSIILLRHHRHDILFQHSVTKSAIYNTTQRLCQNYSVRNNPQFNQVFAVKPFDPVSKTVFTSALAFSKPFTEKNFRHLRIT